MNKLLCIVSILSGCLYFNISPAVSNPLPGQPCDYNICSFDSTYAGFVCSVENSTANTAVIIHLSDAKFADGAKAKRFEGIEIGNSFNNKTFIITPKEGGQPRISGIDLMGGAIDPKTTIQCNKVQASANQQGFKE